MNHQPNRTVSRLPLFAAPLLAVAMLGGCQSSGTSDVDAEPEAQTASGIDGAVQERVEQKSDQTVNKVDQRANQRIDSAIDRGLDRVFR